MRLADQEIDVPGIRDVSVAVAEVTRRAASLAGCRLDHVALCVEAANLNRYVDRVRQQLPAACSSESCIGDPESGMRIAEVQDRDAAIHVVLAAPSGGSGQLVDFLSRTGREGLQHIAFAVPDLRAAVAELAAQGLCFVGGAEDPERAIVEVREGDGWLRQAFTEPLFDEFFVELIERNGIMRMRPENIRSLYDMNEEARRRTAQSA